MPTKPSKETLDEQIRRMTPVSIPLEQREEVRALFRLLDHASHPRQRGTSRCTLVGPEGESTSVPDSVLCILERVAELLAQGDAVTVVPVATELTTQQAADLLNVSRQYLIRLIDEEQIPHSKTGTHRRLQIQDVLTFKKVRDAKRKEQLDELTRLSEEYGGYPELE